MFEFIVKMWRMGAITQEQVNAYCPVFLTQAQREEILAMHKEDNNVN